MARLWCIALMCACWMFPAEDETVANMAEAPPQPSYVATGRLPLHQQAVLLEAWQFMHRWVGCCCMGGLITVCACWGPGS